MKYCSKCIECNKCIKVRRVAICYYVRNGNFLLKKSYSSCQGSKMNIDDVCMNPSDIKKYKSLYQ